MPSSVVLYRLVARGEAGLACDDDGVALGPIPLVWAESDRDEKRTYRALPREQVTEAVACAFGSMTTDVVARFRAGLDRIAKALEAGDAVRARIAAVQLRVPEIAAESLVMLSTLARLRKYNFDPNQPRDDHGRWDNGESSSTATGAAGTQVVDASAGDLDAQHEVARTALRAVWQQSQTDGVEYGGFIYRRNDGTYGATRAVSGWTGGIGRQEADVLTREVPDGATITATFHTHVNNSLFSPEERENFSTLDIITSNKNNWDAYLGTAISGRLKYYNVRDKGRPTDLGRLKE